MCGIVSVLARPSGRAAPDIRDVHGRLQAVLADLTARAPAILIRDGVIDVDRATSTLRDLNRQLLGPPGLRALIGDPAATDAVRTALDAIGAATAEIESELDHIAVELTPEVQEQVNSSVVALKDALWAVAEDRLGMAARVSGLLAREVKGDGLDGWWAVGVALASLDRLEVRGRDSAGLHVLVAGHGLECSHPEVTRLLDGRDRDPLYSSGSVRFPTGEQGGEQGGERGVVSFVYKAAAEIGELGDNVKALSDAIASDALLARALESPDSRVTVLAHTRWASVGIISEANAHPVNSEEADRDGAPYVVAALNGDVDNHAELRQAERLSLAAEITTDAKVIPALVSRRMAEGTDPAAAFMATVARFEGSVAVAASAAAGPDELYLALSGSGQSLYVGLAEDAYIVASEPYGLVEETDRYIRMDGDSTRGEIMVLERSGAGTLDGIARQRYSGLATPVDEAEVVVAEITTRDVDRRGFDHFLLKEITEAPDSFRKTLRGRIVPKTDHPQDDDPGNGLLSVRLGEETIPQLLSEAVEDGTISRIVVIGQGTAAIAGQAVAAALRRCLAGVSVEAMPATELSGFGLVDDMSNTLVVAISQSGTTTDTNRTVDLVRHRGAQVLAMVNRRNSDLAAKAHGVLYTSDGRDVEMSVASTKAFYAQIAAGWLLAVGLAVRAGNRNALDSRDADRILTSLLELPVAMEKVLAKRDEIGRIAAVVAPSRRYWAVVGSGPDKIAASEVRIKLSELCYRSISADTTEDKKHIDLSCEPMIFVCASGLEGPNADDAAKEVAIYKAHKAAPVVVVSEGEDARFEALVRDIVTVPKVDPAVAFVLSAMVGHLFGYEAALAIDAQARPLRAVRGAIEKQTGTTDHDLLDRLRPDLEEAAAPFLTGLRSGAYDGNLDASTSVTVTSLLRYAGGVVPLEAYEHETGKIATPSALIGDLVEALTEAIDQLTRPVDAVKHQAKTVTVGISRSEEALFGIPLVKATLGAGASPDALGYRALRTLASLDEAIAEVLGYTRYRIDWHGGRSPTANVIDNGGMARDLPPSRTVRDPRLLGSKHRAAEEREVTVVRGASDGRTVVLVPEAKNLQVTGMTLLHVRFHERLSAERAAAVLAGYRTRLNALADAVTETEPVFDQARLGEEPIVELLTQPVYELARRWRPASK